jgi:partner of Y14 and mago protein
MGEYVNDQGEKVIMGTRRPDGTFRKDIKVRPGYVPQDEQPVYVPRGAMVSQPNTSSANIHNFSSFRR